MESVLKKRKNVNMGIPINNLFKSNNSKKIMLLNKFVIQVVCCIVILGGLWLYKMSDSVSFDYNKSKYGWILQYNMTYEGTYNGIAKYLNDNFQFNIPLKEIAVNPSNIGHSVNSINDIVEENVIDNSALNENIIADNVIPTNEIEGYNNMQVMAQEIKSNYSLVKPTTGQITCSFGNRESDNNDISTFHLGIDIGNVEGTKIVSAMDGDITEVSKNSIYGNYIKTQKDDVLIVYAHLKKALVKKGDSVKAGDLIGEMGKTGLATGVHLHFEVRNNGAVINPAYLIDFN